MRPRAREVNFYGLLASVVGSGGPHIPTYVVGDFNCHLGDARPEGQDIVGPLSWPPAGGYEPWADVEESREEFIRILLGTGPPAREHVETRPAVQEGDGPKLWENLAPSMGFGFWRD